MGYSKKKHYMRIRLTPFGGSQLPCKQEICSRILSREHLIPCDAILVGFHFELWISFQFCNIEGEARHENALLPRSGHFYSVHKSIVII